MKIAKILSIAAVCGYVTAAAGHALYSPGIVGYINQPLYSGNNYIANQLSTGDNSLDTIFQPGVVPEGTTFTEWNPTTQALLPASTYDTVTGWSINYTLTYGEGGLLNTPSLFTNTFTGGVWSGFSHSCRPSSPAAAR
jgi:hypothetical protein